MPCYECGGEGGTELKLCLRCIESKKMNREVALQGLEQRENRLPSFFERLSLSGSAGERTPPLIAASFFMLYSLYNSAEEILIASPVIQQATTVNASVSMNGWSATSFVLTALVLVGTWLVRWWALWLYCFLFLLNVVFCLLALGTLVPLIWPILILALLVIGFLSA